MTDLALLQAFGLEELFEVPVHSNGHAHGLEAQCFGCGRMFTASRVVPGMRAWCPECRKAGKPAAQRQKDLRERRSKAV